MLLYVVWLTCFGVSIVNKNVEAFRSLLNRKLKPVWSPLAAVHSSDSSSSTSSSSPSSTPTSKKSTTSLDFLNDLVPPFAIVKELTGIGSLDIDEEDESHSEHISSPDVTHFCFLIHGHRGLSKDLAYMQAVMRNLAAAEKRRRRWEPQNSNDLSEDSSSSSCSSHSSAQLADPLIHDIVVHSAVCNEYKTTDGVRNGGDRLVEEMREVIKNEMEKRHPDQNGVYDITMSVLGNSLGGLFGRYAIAKLVERHCEKENETEDACWILDGKYRLHFNVFCTTATPHLGVSRHTYVRIPRTAEIGVAHALGDTGKDLFRLNDLLLTMATCPTFLKPLAKFRKRVAYANAYGTDFAVPAGTAAFLSENSTYPHHFTEEEITVDSNGLIIATLHTPSEAHVPPTTTEADLTLPQCDAEEEVKKYGDHEDELHHMSMSLDRLGWKKVFVDTRKEIPSVEIPKALMMVRQKSNSRLVVDANFHALKKHKVVRSKDVASAVSSPMDNRVPLPLGHNMIVAFSRSRISTFMNKGGRPIVDALAKELVEDIFSWSNSNTSPTTTTTDGDSISSSGILKQ
jgi:hypothetical protein